MGRFSLVKSDKDYKLSEEAAHEQVMQMLAYYDIDVDSMSDEQRTPIERALRKIADFVRRGLVEIQMPKVVQNLQRAPGAVSRIEYGEVTGQNMVSSDASNAAYGKVFALLGSLSGLGAEAFSALKGVDLAVAENLGVVFFSR